MGRPWHTIKTLCNLQNCIFWEGHFTILCPYTAWSMFPILPIWTHSFGYWHGRFVADKCTFKMDRQELFFVLGLCYPVGNGTITLNCCLLRCSSMNYLTVKGKHGKLPNANFCRLVEVRRWSDHIQNRCCCPMHVAIYSMWWQAMMWQCHVAT